MPECCAEHDLTTMPIGAEVEAEVLPEEMRPEVGAVVGTDGQELGVVESCVDKVEMVME